MQSRASDRSVCSRRRSHARAQARLRSLTLLDGLLASHPSLGQCQLAARNRKLGYRVPAACHLHNAPQGGAEQQVSGGARATGGAHAAGRPRHLSQGSRAADQAKRPALHPLREGPALAHRSELRRLLPHHQGLLLALLPRCVLVRRRSQAVEQVHVFVLEFLHRRVLGRCARYDLPTAAGHRVPVLLLALRTESARKWASERTFGPKNLSTFPYKRPTNTLENLPSSSPTVCKGQSLFSFFFLKKKENFGFLTVTAQRDRLAPGRACWTTRWSPGRPESLSERERERPLDLSGRPSRA